MLRAQASYGARLSAPRLQAATAHLPGALLLGGESESCAVFCSFVAGGKTAQEQTASVVGPVHAICRHRVMLAE